MGLDGGDHLVAAVHGMGGSLTHGNPGSVSNYSAVGVHALSGEGAHGAQSFTTATQEKDHGHYDAGAACTQTTPTGPANPHADAGRLGVAAPAGLFLLLLWPASLSDGVRGLMPRSPRTVAVLWLRRRSVRFRRTRLRLSQLSVLRLWMPPPLQCGPRRRGAGRQEHYRHGRGDGRRALGHSGSAPSLARRPRGRPADAAGHLGGQGSGAFPRTAGSARCRGCGRPRCTGAAGRAPWRTRRLLPSAGPPVATEPS